MPAIAGDGPRRVLSSLLASLPQPLLRQWEFYLLVCSMNVSIIKDRVLPQLKHGTYLHRSSVPAERKNGFSLSLRQVRQLTSDLYYPRHRGGLEGEGCQLLRLFPVN